MATPVKRIDQFQPASQPLAGNELLLVSQNGFTRNAPVSSVIPADVVRNGSRNQPDGYAGLGDDGKLSPGVIPNALLGVLQYQQTWDASKNQPALASGIGTKGFFYVCNVAGNTNLDGYTDWRVGDWAVFDGTKWDHLSGRDGIVSVNNKTGAVVTLVATDIPYGTVTVGAELDSLLAAVADHAQRIANLEASSTQYNQRITTLEQNQQSGSADVGDLKTRVSTLEGKVSQDEQNFSTFQTQTSANFGNVNTSIAALQGSRQNVNQKDQANGYAGLDSNGKLKQAEFDGSFVQFKSEKGQANGYAALDANGYVSAGQFPPNVSTTANSVGATDTNNYGSTNVQGLLDAIGGSLKNVSGKQAADETAISNIQTAQQADESHIAANTSDISTLKGSVVRQSQLGTGGGTSTTLVATLDSSTGTLTAAQIPASVRGAVHYLGRWDPRTNNGSTPYGTPALKSGQGDTGGYYVVAAGTDCSGAAAATLDGENEWFAGDEVIFNGTTWDHEAGAKSRVVTVNNVSPDSAGNVNIPIATTATNISANDPNNTGSTNVQGQLDKVGSKQVTDEAAISQNATNVAALQTGKVDKSVLGQPTTTTGGVTTIGVPTLDTTGKVPLAQIPSGATTSGSNVNVTDTYGLVGAAGSTVSQQAIDDRLSLRRLLDAGYNGAAIDCGYNGS